MSKMRRAPSQLDDAIARFERNLRQLVVGMVLVELEHLRAVPLAVPGARSRSHPAPAASSARSSVRNKRAAAAAVARTATRSTTAAAAAPVVPVAEPVAPVVPVAEPVDGDGDAATASTAPVAATDEPIPVASAAPPTSAWSEREGEPREPRRERVQQQRADRAAWRRERQERARRRRAAADLRGAAVSNIVESVATPSASEASHTPEMSGSALVGPRPTNAA
jgi:hypothetical protein